MSIRVSIVMRMTLSLHVISHLVQSRAAALFGKALIDRLMCWHGVGMDGDMVGSPKILKIYIIIYIYIYILILAILF